MLQKIRKDIITKSLLKKYKSDFEKAIRIKSLYFRISLIGECNLNCSFCHNEGGPKKGHFEVQLIPEILKAATQIGFTRIQFTGGEPLLSPEVDEFIKHARQYSNDVGITTNGLLLKGCLSKLISAGINRIHVSIPPNIISNKNGFDSIKYLDELKEIIKEAESQAVNMKINLPLSEIPSKKNILSKIINFNTPIRILTLFDFNGNSPMEHQNEYSFRKLNFEKYQDRIHLREHFTPNGVRCDQCNSLLNCKEKSRSLRLGVDNVLRPCLASREWDVKLSLNNIDESLKVATALALDY